MEDTTEMNRKVGICLAFPIAFLLSVTPGAGQEQTLWEIGKDAPRTAVFQSGPKDHIAYEVGKNDWRRDWPGVERTGAAYEVHFSIDGAPRGVFTLTVRRVLSYRGNAALGVEINGHKGTFYQRPDPMYLGHGASFDTTVIAIPAGYIKRGANTLVLSAVAVASHEGAAAQPVQSIRYDYIRLVNAPGASYARVAFHADVVPTIFYREKNGHLTEVVEAYLRFGRSMPAGMAMLTVNGQGYKAEVPAQADFGESRVVFDVAEWQGAAKALLEVNAGARRAVPLTLTAERKWTVYLVPHTHLDVGYTDYQGKAAENQATTLTEAAALIKQYPDFRFATDASWNVKQLLETRSKADSDEVLNLAREGKIGIPADYFNLLTGYASLETLYRSLYYTKALSKEYGVPFDYATTTDVPTYTGAYPSVLASAGVKYWAVGGNGDRAPVLTDENWDTRSPFWWQGPDGQKVLFWYSHGYSQILSVFSLDPKTADIHEALPVFLAAYDRPDYKPDAVLVYGAQYENTDLHDSLAIFAGAWNREYAWPRLQYATFGDFLSYIDRKYGAALPTIKGDMGPYWEDGIGSDAYYAAIDRRNQSDALSAETVATVAHVIEPGVNAPAGEVHDIWNNILSFAEHTWGASGSISQPDSFQSVGQLAIKDNFAIQAQMEVKDLTDRSLYQLVNKVQTPANAIVVFNALNWKRDALIEADTPPNEEIVDLTTQQTVPVELLWAKEGIRRVRFLATDLPPVGYRSFQLRRASVAASNATAIDNPVIENKYYRVTVDSLSGAVRSIYDKELNREITDPASPYRFGQYLYVTGGDPKGNGQSRMIHPDSNLPVAELAIHPAGKGEYLGATKTAWGYSIKLRSSDVNAPAVNLEILLYDGEKRMDFNYTVDKTYTTDKEAVYFAFPTATSTPQFAYGTQQGSVDPAKDLLKGASLEWFSVQKWMAAYDSTMTVGIVPIDASLASLGDINRGLWPVEFKPKSATMFSYAMNNYWHTNYRAGQGGTFTFRYAITSTGHFDPAVLSRFGWESLEAPPVDVVAGNDKAGDKSEPLPAEGTSFLSIDAPNVVLVTWKRAEDGNGTILRLEETAGRDEDATVELSHAHILSAHECNSVEDDLQMLPVTNGRVQLKFHPYQVITVRLATESAIEEK
jgi:alpha-mannosidase